MQALGKEWMKFVVPGRESVVWRYAWFTDYTFIRTIDGINDKGWLGPNSHAGLVRLFADEGDARELGGEPSRDHLLDALVRLRDDVNS